MTEAVTDTVTDNAVLIPTPETAVALDALARRYRAAGGIGMHVLTLIGGRAENLLERLPDPVKDRLDGATLRALEVAAKAAGRSRGGALPDGGAWANTAVTTVMGAAGGFGGLPTALAELPATTTVLLRAIQSIAESYGFDTNDPQIRAACIQVFAAAGPLADDDGADLGFLAARVTLTGASVHGLIAKVAPRLAVAMGQKLAAQTVPVVGAVAGAGINFAFSRYYQEIAHVRFGLKQLSRDSGVDEALLVGELRARMTRSGRLR
ncbi:EcsC family protein [Actibacterium sp. D379-3]